jgi:hypothetical protein
MSRIGLAAMAGFAIAFILGRKLRCDKKKTKNKSCLVIKMTKIVEIIYRVSFGDNFLVK